MGGRGVAGVVCAAALLTAPAPAAARDPYQLGSHRAFVAEVVRATPIRARPGDGPRRGTQGAVAPWGHGAVRLLVLGSALAPDGRRWLHVRLQRRPNTAAGWIRADDTRLSVTLWRILVSRRMRMLTLLRAGRVRWRTRIVIGRPATPTPAGLFAIAEIIRQPHGSELGPLALHLTAHSPVLFDYGGGPGRVAIHGRSGPLLADPLGSARSHGCIRVPNRAVLRLAHTVRAGTPVVVR